MTTPGSIVTVQRTISTLPLRYRDALLVDGTYFIDAGKSSHELKVGVDVQKFNPNIGTIRNPMGRNYTWDGEPYFRYTYTDELGPTTNDQDWNSIYAQDEWRMGKLTLNLGLRFDSDQDLQQHRATRS